MGSIGNCLKHRKLVRKSFLSLCRQACYSIQCIKRWGRFPRRFIVDAEKQLVYLNNPKVACSSIKKSIFGEHLNIHAYVGEYTVNELSPEMEDYYKFTFVRNPYKRLISCFEDKCIQHPDDGCWDSYFLSDLFRIDNFNQFIWRVCLIPDCMAEPHFAGQYQSVYDKKGKCLVDFVGKIENIGEEYTPIRERLNLLPLSQSNQASSLTGKNWMDYYTPFTAALVYHKYKKDFMTFGYEKEYKTLKKHLKNKR